MTTGESEWSGSGSPADLGGARGRRVRHWLVILALAGGGGRRSFDRVVVARSLAESEDHLLDLFGVRLYEGAEALQELTLGVQERRHRRSSVAGRARCNRGCLLLRAANDRGCLLPRAREDRFRLVRRIRITNGRQAAGPATSGPKAFVLLDVRGEVLGDSIEEGIDVALVVTAEREPELDLLHVGGRETPGAGCRLPFGFLLPAHGLPPLRRRRATPGRWSVSSPGRFGEPRG